MDLGQCSFCNKTITDEEKVTDVRTVRYKGIQTLIKKSMSIQDGKWKEWKKLDKEQYITAHERCRIRYISQSDKPLSERRGPKLADPTNDDLNYETPTKPFDYEALCIFCDKKLNTAHKKVHALNTQLDQTSLVEWSKTTDDEHAKEILRRIKYLRDNSITGRYHDNCRRKCAKVEPYIPKTDKVAIEKSFETVTNYIENSGEYKFEISKFRKIMEENDVLALSDHVLSKKLEEKYGDDLLIVRHLGRAPAYFYKTNNLFERSQEWLTNPQSLSDFDKSILIKLAADIIKHEVLHKQSKAKNDSSEESSLSNVMSDNPRALDIFTDRLLQGTTEINQNVKRDNINQTIIRSLCLKKITPEPVLQEIFCYCVGDCSTARCTCKKISSKCSHLCKNCNNQTCTNYPLAQLPVEIEYETVYENMAVDDENNEKV